MKKGTIWRVLGIGLLLIAFGIGCGSGDEGPTEPIKVGLLLPLTGPDPAFAVRLRTGIEAAFEEQDYEVAGREIELIIEDAAADPAIGLDQSEKIGGGRQCRGCNWTAF